MAREGEEAPAFAAGQGAGVGESRTSGEKLRGKLPAHPKALAVGESLGWEKGNFCKKVQKQAACLCTSKPPQSQSYLVGKSRVRSSNRRKRHFTNFFVLQGERERVKTTGTKLWPALEGR